MQMILCTKCGQYDAPKHFKGNVCKKCKSVSSESGIIYVLCDADNIGRYKIGKHTGSREKLIKRYQTYFPKTEILRFVEVPRALMVERYIHRALSDFRINNSEWFEIDEPRLFMIFDNLIDEFL
jgi:hypothetical protein